MNKNTSQSPFTTILISVLSTVLSAFILFSIGIKSDGEPIYQKTRYEKKLESNLKEASESSTIEKEEKSNSNEDIKEEKPKNRIPPKSKELIPIGSFQGNTLNYSCNCSGKLDLQLFDYKENEGTVKGNFYWYDGLSGEGILSGIVNRDGSIRFSGIIAADWGRWTTTINCKSLNKLELNCKYSLIALPGDNTGNQNGEFTVKK